MGLNLVQWKLALVSGIPGLRIAEDRASPHLSAFGKLAI